MPALFESMISRATKASKTVEGRTNAKTKAMTESKGESTYKNTAHQPSKPLAIAQWAHSGEVSGPNFFNTVRFCSGWMPVVEIRRRVSKKKIKMATSNENDIKVVEYEVRNCLQNDK